MPTPPESSSERPRLLIVGGFARFMPVGATRPRSGVSPRPMATSSAVDRLPVGPEPEVGARFRPSSGWRCNTSHLVWAARWAAADTGECSDTLLRFHSHRKKTDHTFDRPERAESADAIRRQAEPDRLGSSAVMRQTNTAGSKNVAQSTRAPRCSPNLSLNSFAMMFSSLFPSIRIRWTHPKIKSR